MLSLLRISAAALGLASFLLPALPAQTQSPALRAKAAFEKVDTSPIPSLADAKACAEAHAALLPQVRQDQKYLVHYRKGYCEIFAAVASKQVPDYEAASQDLTQAVLAWPAQGAGAKSSGLRALLAIANLQGGIKTNPQADVVQELTSLNAPLECSSTAVMQTSFCQALAATAQIWLGWLAFQQGRPEDAAKVLEAQPDSPWSLWISGRQMQRARRFPEAISAMEKALTAWEQSDRSQSPAVQHLLGPKPDYARCFYELGDAQYRAEKYEAAVKSLDEAFRRGSPGAFAYFLRGRSKDLLADAAGAMADYEAATRIAKQNSDTSWAVGQAYYYRGLRLYRDKQYSQAEVEFGNALGSALGEVPKAEAAAWRELSKAASGGCQALDALEASVRSTSDPFLSLEAKTLIFRCRLASANTLETMLAFEEKYRTELSPEQSQQLKMRIADAYAAQGVAAEDRKDIPAAADAYRKGLEWNPNNVKARFNLAAIYLDERRFKEAETEFRALLKGTPNDYESQYWLSETILAQRPGPIRRAEACRLLKQALAIENAAKRAQYGKRLASLKCPE